MREHLGPRGGRRPIDGAARETIIAAAVVDPDPERAVSVIDLVFQLGSAGEEHLEIAARIRGGERANLAGGVAVGVEEQISEAA